MSGMEKLTSLSRVRWVRAPRGHWPGLIQKNAAVGRAMSCARRAGRTQRFRKKTDAMEMMLFMPSY
ncbi:hypothetical protein BRAS3809_870002 [Bradyrhizobium sp. STM 3809]|nr:hypothetical protein BRAS3809_870002 [Bradyrhizobium sp. STM 3809]